MINKSKRLFCILSLFFVLAGCISTRQIVSSPNDEIPPTLPLPTKTATLTLPTFTNTVISPTVTPYPTLIPSETIKFIDQLASDEICSYPCWAGVIPGNTNWDDISAYIASFAKVARHSPTTQKGNAIYIPLSNQYPDNPLWISIFLDENNTVKLITGWRYNLPINRFFSEYGKPEHIYLYTIGVLPSDEMEIIRFGFSYESRGFFVVYGGETKNQSVLEICPMKNIKKGPYFWLWNPQSDDTMKTIVDGGVDYRFDGEWRRYKEITDATNGNITVDWFYKTYIDTTNANTCFQVPSPNAP